jgi:hypothetical protein
MADNIGTHAAALIDACNEVSWNLRGLGRLGVALTATDPDDFYNLVDFLTGLQVDRLDALTVYLQRNVLPVVAHINDRVPV